MIERDWYWYDFLLISGDAYVDHPSFGTAVIGRVLEAEGFRVAVLAQPDWRSTEPFLAFGKPRLGILIGAIQAYIFSVLAMVYIASAIQAHEHETAKAAA